MADTFNNDLRVREQEAGSNSGTWGGLLNTTISNLASAFGQGSEAIPNASTHTITLADGAADEARSMYLKCTGGGQACTVTLAPNTISKVWIISNETSFTLTFTQGSGANVAVAAGAVKMIVTDGAGATGAVTDALSGLSANLSGATTTGDISFGDNDKAIFGAGSDLELFYNGTHSVFKDGSAGNIYIQDDNNIILGSIGGENYLVATKDGAVTLYHDAVAKLATTSTGIDVTGTSLADTLETSTASGGLINVIRDDSTTGTNNSLGAIYWKSTEDSGTTVNIGAGILALADQNHSTTASGSRLVLQTTAVSATSPTERLRISAGGDISFYEDTGTTPKLFWDASAESLGIGTTSLTSNATLSVAQGGVHVDGGASGGSSQVILSTGASSGSNFGQISNTGTRWALGYGGTPQTVGTEVLTWNSSNNVGIGVTPESWNTYKTLQIGNGAIANYTPTHDMRVVSNAYYNSGWKYAESDGACLYLQDGDNSTHIWAYAASGTADAALTWDEAMRIRSDGCVGVNTTDRSNAGTRLAVWADTGSVSIETRCKTNVSYFPLANYSAAGSYIGGINATTTATSLATSSDRRLKSGIQDADDAGSKVDAIQVRQFDWIANNAHQDYGMVAQELREVIPSVIHESPDADKMLSVDYAGLVPMLVKEIQSLRARVAQLENN